MKLNRKQKLLAGLACIALYSVPLVTINGAFDIFMKTEGSSDIPDGEYDGAYPEFQGWIEIDSFSVGAFNAAYIDPKGVFSSGNPSLSSMNITKPVDQTSPGFFKALTAGSQIPEVKLFLRRSGTTEDFMKLYLKTVVVDSVSWSGSSGGGEAPYESISLFYGSFKVEYSKFLKGNPTDTYSAEWNQVTKKAAY